MINIIRSADRGKASHGWLESRFSFSFSDYHDPERIHFGKLRVVNDDILAPGTGFDTHQHSNMEIITIPLKGNLSHRDSVGHVQTIGPGEIQVMSAGSGIFHSEYNASDEKTANFLQIWIFPDQKNAAPRYDQKSFSNKLLNNTFQQVVSGQKENGNLWIHQDATLFMAKLQKETTLSLPIISDHTGLFLFVIEGELQIEGNTLFKRDAAEIKEHQPIRITATKASFVLAIRIPL